MIDLKIVSLPIADELKREKREEKQRAKLRKEENKLRQQRLKLEEIRNIQLFKEFKQCKFKRLIYAIDENGNKVITIDDFNGVSLADAYEMIDTTLKTYNKVKAGDEIVRNENYRIIKREIYVKDFPTIQIGCQIIPLSELKSIFNNLKRVKQND